MKRSTAITSIAASLALVAAGYIQWYFFGPEAAAPDYDDMRRFILSNSTNEQIQEVIELSRKQLIAAKLRAATEASEQTRLNTERLQKCDEVYRLRNPEECSAGGGFRRIFGLGLKNDDETLPARIERNIMGICLYAKSVRQAREWKCLPAR